MRFESTQPVADSGCSKCFQQIMAPAAAEAKRSRRCQLLSTAGACRWDTKDMVSSRVYTGWATVAVGRGEVLYNDRGEKAGSLVPFEFPGYKMCDVHVVFSCVLTD